MITVSTVPNVNTGGTDELSKFCQSRLVLDSAIGGFGGSLRLMCSSTVALSGSDADVSAGSAATFATKLVFVSVDVADSSAFAPSAAVVAAALTKLDAIAPRK
jgi:hypothetical protein